METQSVNVEQSRRIVDASGCDADQRANPIIPEHLVRFARTCSVAGAVDHESKRRKNRYSYPERA
jgi:hypothetical protein